MYELDIEAGSKFRLRNSVNKIKYKYSSKF